MAAAGRCRREAGSAPAGAGRTRRACGLLWAAAAALALAFGLPVTAPAAPQPLHTNRLIHSDDPYLLLHAHNPVDWYPWGPEAIARARKEHKPIFLSIGYSTCYWCHVADRNLFSNPAIAKLMNRWFINVVVDREQRPDIDRIYMLASEIMNGQGGWPNNVFLTPDLKPFFSGSYFPPQSDEFGRPGFPSILRMIHEQWTTDRAAVIAKANRVYAQMKEVNLNGAGVAPAPVRPQHWLAAAERSTQERFDWKYGGIPNGPNKMKFPREPLLHLWFVDATYGRNAEAMKMLRATLDAMAYGGIHDQIGGGFHRYSIDRDWSIPHFEKMLADNAQLLGIYAQAYAVTRDRLYRSVALDTARYLEREMAAPQGGFYIAQDAQIHGVEGGGYVWTRKRIVTALGKTGAARFFQIYGLTRLANPTAEEELNGQEPAALRVRIPIAATLKRAGYKDVTAMLAALAPARAKLLAVRERGPRPTIDRKVVVGLNGLAISAFTLAAGDLNHPRFLTVASRTAARIWKTAYDPHTRTLRHEIYRGRARTPGFLDDYALLGNGFLDLYRATHSPVWLKRARALGDDIIGRFLRADGALATTPFDKDLLIEPRDLGDDNRPSGVTAAVMLLQRLGTLTGEPRYADVAARVVRHISGEVAARPAGWGSLVAFLAEHPLPAAPARAARVAPQTPAAPRVTRRPVFRVPGTADHVRAGAVREVIDGRPEVVVTLHIDPGYHVNANPASFSYLIPTSVRFEGVTPKRVQYPKPVRITPAFARQGLLVYEGVARIRAVFPPGRLDRTVTIRGSVRVQACNDQTCLPPATLPLKVPPAAAP